MLGSAARERLQHRFAALFRINTAAGVTVLALLAGWAFQGGTGEIAALAVLLGAQVGAVCLGAWLFRSRADGPVVAYAAYGNPGFWSIPVSAAVLGPRAAVVVAAYDMLTQPRLALGLRRLRAGARVPQSRGSALVDYAPMAAAVAGLGLGALVPASPAVAQAVVVLGTLLSGIGAVLLGLAWPRRAWRAAANPRAVLRFFALHLTVAPLALVAAGLAGLAVPAGAWIIALGPLPFNMVAFARLYGFPVAPAACALALSFATAVLLLPLATWLGRTPPW